MRDSVLEGAITRFQNLLTGISNVKTLHDYDNCQADLDVPAYVDYKTGADAPGYETKSNDLKQFF